jgi:hypothetical protein
MTSREFTESLAFERLEPDPARETVRLLGLIAMLFFNVHRDREVKPEPYDFEDFVPDPYGIPKAERVAEFRRVQARMAVTTAARRAQKAQVH